MLRQGNNISVWPQTHRLFIVIDHLMSQLLVGDSLCENSPSKQAPLFNPRQIETKLKEKVGKRRHYKST